MYPSRVELLLTLPQLRGCAARYIFGSGALGQYVLRHLPAKPTVIFVDTIPHQPVHGYPLIDLRVFCARASRAETVVLASDDPLLLTLLVAIGQERILDAREICRSDRVCRHGHSSPGSSTAVLSTIPRSGTYRLRYFFFSLNEYLSSPSAEPNAHKLYAYSRSDWNSPTSPYRPSRVLAALGVLDLRVGHYVPPGALAYLSANAAVARLQEHRVARFRESCQRNPGLSVVSQPLRPWMLEPPVEQSTRGRVRYALVARDIVDQITSQLTVWELLLEKCKREGAAVWPLEEYVRRCHNRLRPFVFFGLDGLAPLILQQCVRESRSFTDLVLQSEHIDSLVTDYAIQLYGCRSLETRTRFSGTAQLFHYEEMIADGLRFLRQLVEFLKGASLNQLEQEAVERACQRTTPRAMVQLERELGHAIFFRDGLEKLFAIETHLTGHSCLRERAHSVREATDCLVRREADRIRARLAQLYAEMEQASRPYLHAASTQYLDPQG